MPENLNKPWQLYTLHANGTRLANAMPYYHEADLFQLPAIHNRFSLHTGLLQKSAPILLCHWHESSWNHPLFLNYHRMIELVLLLTKITMMVLLLWRYQEKRSCTHLLVRKTDNLSNSDKDHIVLRRDCQQQCHNVERRLSRSRLKDPRLRSSTIRSTKNNFVPVQEKTFESSDSNQISINCDQNGGLCLACMLASYPGILPWSRGVRA